MVAPLSDVPQEGSSVFSLFSLVKLHLASLPLASSYSRVAVSSVFWAQNIYFSAQTRGAPLIGFLDDGSNMQEERVQLAALFIQGGTFSDVMCGNVLAAAYDGRSRGS